MKLERAPTGNMQNLDSDVGGWPSPIVALGAPPPQESGFTAADLALLDEAYRSGVAQRGWGPALLAANDFARYLAVWEKPPVDREPPMLAIIRFDDTGTYALLAQGEIVASGRSLPAIMPALLVAASPARQPARAA